MRIQWFIKSKQHFLCLHKLRRWAKKIKNNMLNLWNQKTALSHIGWPRRIGSPSEVRRFGADGSIFGRKSDPIAEAEANFFSNPIRFSPIRQYASLIGLKRIGSDSIFRFFVGSDRIHFYFLSDRKIKTASDPIRWPP